MLLPALSHVATLLGQDAADSQRLCGPGIRRRWHPGLLKGRQYLHGKTDVSSQFAPAPRLFSLPRLLGLGKAPLWHTLLTLAEGGVPLLLLLGSLNDSNRQAICTAGRSDLASGTHCVEEGQFVLHRCSVLLQIFLCKRSSSSCLCRCIANVSQGTLTHHAILPCSGFKVSPTCSGQPAVL